MPKNAHRLSSKQKIARVRCQLLSLLFGSVRIDARVCMPGSWRAIGNGSHVTSWRGWCQLFSLDSSRSAEASEALIRRMMPHLEYQQSARPTVCLDVTSLAANTYGCDSGRIGPTRCAVIDAARGDRWRTHQASRTSRAAIHSARSVLVGGSRPVSTAVPGGFPLQQRTHRV